jgi:transposase
MKTNKPNANTHNTTQTQKAPKAKIIKLGIDVHADSYRVVRQLDNAAPQPAQKFTPVDFLLWAAKQLTQAGQVHSCYEAGPFGYGLHRALLKMGVHNVVVRPQNWDELGKGVKTDRTDARALVERLDRYVQGNPHALAVVTVPTPEQERERAQSRHREQLLKDRQAHEAQGRSFLLYHDRRVRGRWWETRFWEQLAKVIEPWQKEILENLRKLILLADEQLQKTETQLLIDAKSPARGFGSLSCELLRREVLDWKRFKNRRQVASLTGMCPGVRASGLKSISGSITKHGNPRIRRLLVEMAWRVARYQPDYGPVKRWKSVLAAKAHPGGRKKAIVAIGRKLAIDIWRLETERTTVEELHLCVMQ